MSLTQHSYTFTVTGDKSELVCVFNPPIYLHDWVDYEIALLNFESYNAIANVDETNNELHFEYPDRQWNKLKIPVGTYNFDDIAKSISDQLENEWKENVVIILRANNNTQRSHIKSTVNIDFSQDNSIGQLLGFDKKVIDKTSSHISDSIVNINKVNAIQIYCNIVSGSYTNGEQVHVLHHFFPAVPAGFKIIESPQQPIYLPVSTKVVSRLTFKLLDQDGNFVNFQGESITVRVHLRQISAENS